MSIRTPAQIEQLKRAAKKLTRTSSLTHAEALDRLAVENGFKNWSLLTKHSNRSTSVPSVPALSVAAAKLSRSRRYYLHGDQHEEDAEKFHCAQCDLFTEANHFFSQHPVEETLERCLNSLDRWERRPRSETATQRPIGARNMLEQQARARAADHEAARAPFHRWLERQKARDTIVGDFAKDVMSDKNFPVAATTYAEMLSYMENVSASDAAIIALKEAWKKFNASVKRAANQAIRET